MDRLNDESTIFSALQSAFHYFLFTEGASPISLSQLPPYCASVRTSRRDLEMMVPYDACYITQEVPAATTLYFHLSSFCVLLFITPSCLSLCQNGNYVLPMLWLGNPLNLSCPVQMSILGPSVPHSAPSVFCSPYGMAVQIDGQEQDMHMLGIIGLLALLLQLMITCALLCVVWFKRIHVYNMNFLNFI